jgi:hypothetical protein
MARVLLSRANAHSDRSADAIVASLGRKLLAFIVWPFSIALAMRPQREREAARIAHDFRTDLHSGRETASLTSSRGEQDAAAAAHGKARAVNIGYILFSGGVIWLSAIAVWGARGTSVPNCDLIACSGAGTSAPQKLASGVAGARLEAHTSLAGQRYSAHMHWLTTWAQNNPSE